MWGQLTKITRILQPVVFNNFLKNAHRNYSILFPQIQMVTQPQPALLQPQIIGLLPQQRGMKQVGRCKKRCKDCYFVVRQERM